MARGDIGIALKSNKPILFFSFFSFSAIAALDWRAAFGKQSCVKLERNGRGTWLQVGKKQEEKWDWKKAKLSDVEIAVMLCVHITGGD